LINISKNLNLKVMSKLLHCCIATLLKAKKQFNNLAIKQSARGFTFIEVLVAITIISLITTGSYVSIKKNLNRAHDNQRKEDIKALAQALEQYHNDNFEYPPPTTYADTEYASDGSPNWIPDLQPYLKNIPSDPKQIASVFNQLLSLLHINNRSTKNPQVAGIVNTTLGETNIGPSLDSSNQNKLKGNMVTTGPYGATVTSMSVYIGPTVGNNPKNKYVMAIYSNKVGFGGLNSPDSVVANTAEGTLTANDWNTLPIAATLSPNTIYWLLYNTNGTDFSANNPRNFNVTPGLNQDKAFDATFGSFPANTGTGTSYNVRMSIYANITYTEPDQITLTGNSYCSGTTPRVQLDWTTNTSDTSYTIFRDGLNIGSVSATTFDNAPPVPPAANDYYVRGNQSSVNSNTINITNATCSPPPPQCSDGIDNSDPEDTLVDFPTDPGCSSTTDDDETNPPPPPGSTACQNKEFIYCYITNAGRSTYTLWAQLENTSDPEINTNSSAKCTLPTPTDTTFNFCLESPIN